ncbi:MAG: nucleotidyltransferase family protein [Vicinamibacterales bacterium]|nr:nucleotidyltransferase family protein [Vicinamibacterales bacterium]
MAFPVAILAGGLATRLDPITERVPKSLVDVAGRPFAAHQIELLGRHGLTDIVFLVGHLGEMIRYTLGDGARWGVRLRYVFDGSRAVGTGGAVRKALPELGDAFFVLYGDSYLDCDYREIERTFGVSGKSGLMTVCRNDDRWDRSNVLLSEGRIIRYDKQRPTADMRHIDYGLGVFKAAAFAAHPEDEPLDLATVYEDLLARNDLAAFEVPTRFYEIGSPSGLEETRAHIAHKRTAIT